MKTIWTTHPSHSVCHLPSQGKAFLYGILPLIRGLYPRVILSAVELRSSAEGGISRGFSAYLSQDPFVTSFLGFARILAKLRLRATPYAQDDMRGLVSTENEKNVKYFKTYLFFYKYML